MMRLRIAAGMYTDWFKLKKLPFRLRPDPEFLYLGGDAGLAYESLRAATTEGHKMVCLIGESGVGKTTLLHALARDCQGVAPVARVQQPNLTSEELTASLVEQFALPLQDDSPQPLLARLRHFVAVESGQGRMVVILVDEAHLFSGPMLRDLLVLTAWPSPPVVVLAGEEELLNSLATIETSGVAMPTISTLRLARLAQKQITEYLNHRLRIAGSEGRELFEPDTMGDILRYTGGVPQLINTLCDSAMMFAAAHSVARVGIIEIRDAARELNWIEYSARSALPAVPDTAGPLSPSTAAPATRLALEVRRDERLVEQVPLAAGSLIVGRGAGAGLHLESRYVSRRHCQIFTTTEQSVIEDLDSANGIRVNGERCRVHILAPGDTIELADYTLTCILSQSPATS